MLNMQVVTIINSKSYPLALLEIDRKKASSECF